MHQPKVLIVNRLNWVDNSSSNTRTNLWKNYNPDRLALIYIETKSPDTVCCSRFFQISEFSLIKKLFNWHIKTGQEVFNKNDVEESTAKKEQNVMTYVRSHRLFFFSFLRELLWLLNGWETKELRDFIRDFNPDVVWIDGSPLILMNRLNNYIISVAKKPAVTFLMDDVYCYESCTSFSSKIYKYFLRKQVRKTVKLCKHVFVASLKMKQEYDAIFGINSTFISKSINTSALKTYVSNIHKPLRLVYLGNLLIGRLESLIAIAECINDINKDGQKITLSIYSNTQISDKQRQKLLIDDGVYLFPPVPYSDVPGIISNSDVQVFSESMDGNDMAIARLSFSTKIIDYLGSGKCILAVGAGNVAPIEYFQSEDAALVATNKDELMQCMNELLNDNIIREYAEKAVACCKRNHDQAYMHDLIYTTLQKVAKL